MTTGYYGRIENTVVSGSELRSYLSGAEVTALEFESAMVRVPPITLVATDTALSAGDLIEAATHGLLVNGSGLTAATDLTIGTDSASQAAAYIRLFDLQSTNDRRILTFQISDADNAAFATNFANTSGTHVSVNVQLNGAADAATQVLWAASLQAGRMDWVEVSASVLTSGSEVVEFNVINGRTSA